MKQTAVDYLFEKLWDQPKDKLTWYKIAGDAKNMEKEQIIKAYDSGAWEVDCIDANSEEHYTETYENES
jgi:hypothetical protein